MIPCKLFTIPTAYVRQPYSYSVPSPDRLFKNSSTGFHSSIRHSGIRARICKSLRSPEIDSEESIPPAYVARPAGTTNSVVVRARQAGNRFLGSLKGIQIRAQESIPAWRAGIATVSVVPARQAHSPAESIPRNQFLGSINVYKYGL